MFIGVIKRETGDIKETKIWDPTAFIHMYTPYNPDTDKHLVTGNVA